MLSSKLNAWRVALQLKIIPQTIWFALIPLIFCTQVSAQFERIDQIIGKFETQMEGTLFNPEIISRDILSPKNMEMILIWPLEWEADKIKLQMDTLSAAQEKLTTEIEEQQRALNQLQSQLFELGHMEESSLAIQVRNDRERKTRLIGFQKELAAFQQVIEPQRSEARQRQQLETEIAKEQEQIQKAQLEQFVKVLKNREGLKEQGYVTEAEVEKAQHELRQAMVALEIAELRRLQSNQQTDLSPEQQFELAKIESQIAKLASEIDSDALDAGKLKMISNLIREKQRLQQKYEHDVKQLNDFVRQQSHLEMEQTYLNTILQRYRDSLAKGKEQFEGLQSESKPSESDDK